jgi:type II secretory pathway pseudopilin PulG
MIELLVVIGIIGLLAAILLTAIWGVRRSGKITKCLNNLRQLQTALEIYRTNHNDFPPWLAALWPSYCDQREAFVCPMDLTEGTEGGRPDWITQDQFPNADKDGPDRDNPGSGQENWFSSSYLYEFNSEPCEWMASVTGAEKDAYDTNGDGVISWLEAKLAQVNGIAWDGMSREAHNGAVPVIRCFWHCREEGGLDNTDKVLNITYNYRVYQGRPKWEDDN